MIRDKLSIGLRPAEAIVIKNILKSFFQVPKSSEKDLQVFLEEVHLESLIRFLFYFSIKTKLCTLSSSLLSLL